MNPRDDFMNARLSVAKLAALKEHFAAEMSKTAATSLRSPTDLLLTTMPSPPTYATAYVLTDADVARIASAVADELERRAAHPLRVTPADIAKVTK